MPLITVTVLTTRYIWWCHLVVKGVFYGMKLEALASLTSLSAPMDEYCKWEKICWAKLSCFSRFSGVPRKFFREYKCLSLIILNNEYLWPRQCENISVKTSMALKL